VTAAVCVSAPLVAVIVSGYVPAATAAVVVMFSVEEPVPVTEAGLNVGIARSEERRVGKETEPAKPPIALVDAVYVVPPPCAIVCAAGLAVYVESGRMLFPSVTAAVCVSAPLVAVIVSGYVPSASVAVVVMFSVEEPVPVTEAGLNVGIA